MLTRIKYKTKRHLKCPVLVMFFFLFTLTSRGQQSIADSLLLALKAAKHDTAKLSLLVQLSEECELTEILKYTNPAIELADGLLSKMKDQPVQQKSRILYQKAIALNNTGYLYENEGNIPKALNYYDQSLKIQKEIGNKEGIALSLNNIGLIYDNQGDVPKALDFYSRSLKIREEINDKYGIANSLNNIGFIYQNQGDILKALDYFRRSLKIYEETGDKKTIANSLINIGAIYNSQGNFPGALDYWKRSLKIQEDIGNKQGIAYSLNDIGLIYNRQGDITNALNFFGRTLKIQKEIGDKKGVANSLANIGVIYFKQKKYLRALSCLDSSLTVSKELGFPENIRNAERMLAKTDSARGNYTGAFEHYKQFIIHRDSLANEATRKASLKSQLKYEYEKKEAVIKEQQQKESAVAEEKNRVQQIIIGSVSAGLLLVIVFAGFVFRSLKTARRQKIIIEEKQKDILDSIHYARRIQASLLPTEKYIGKILDKHNSQASTPEIENTK